MAKTPMSDEHKAALAEGREEGRIVRAYLDALETHKPKRGRKRTLESVLTRLAAVERELAEQMEPMDRLILVQERIDLLAEQDAMQNGDHDLVGLEVEFLKVAKSYSQRKGLSYEAWRVVGVEPRVLKAAGIGRGTVSS